MTQPLIDVQDLHTHFFTDHGVVRAVDGVDFSIGASEAVGMVGESGCGKSVTALSLMRLVDRPGEIVGGRILLRGDNLLDRSARRMQQIRGNEISMIFQEPMTSLNPVQTIGRQIEEALKLHQAIGDAAATRRASELLEMVGIAEAARRLKEYPYQLSGGMRQRVMIAIALSCNPSLLIADEPTTALDVTIQAQVLDVIRNLRKELGTALLIITHDMGVISEVADRVIVLYAGKVVEHGEVRALFRDPKHPYTQGLLASMPRLDGDRHRKLVSIPGTIPDLVALPAGCLFSPRCRFAIDHCRMHAPPLFETRDGRSVRCWMHDPEELALGRFRAMPEPAVEVSRRSGTESRAASEGGILPKDRTPAERPAAAENQSITERPLLEVTGLKKHFPIPGGVLHRTVRSLRAVDGVDFHVMHGETIGLVGESGSGKTTTGRLVMRLLEPTEGHVLFEGRDIFRLSRSALRELRRDVQIIFQDPFGSLNPRMKVSEILEEPFVIHGRTSRSERRDRAAGLLETVGLRHDHLSRYPHQFSGGQRQRIGIARALALQPKLIVCDEPVSALDVSIQSQIINLLEELQERFGLTYVLIAHDLSVVRHASDWVAVMYLGKIVEYADTDTLFADPRHPYTEALLSAVPVADPDAVRNRIILSGSIPSASNPPSGCPFHTRCPIARKICREVAPKPVNIRRASGRSNATGGITHIVSCHFRGDGQV